MNSIPFDLEPNTFLFFLVERICSNNIESEKRAHILQVYSSNKITCVTMLRIVRGVCIKSVQNFVLARLEKIYKKNSTSVCSHAKVLWSWGVSRRKLPFPSILLCDLLAEESWHVEIWTYIYWLNSNNSVFLNKVCKMVTR